MAWNDSGEVMFGDERYRLTRLGGPVYVAEVNCHLTEAVVADMNQRIWSDQEWRQPWGFLMALSDAATYDKNLRHYTIPPPDKRAAAMVITSSKPIYRMVITSMGLGLRLSHGFSLGAAESLRAGLAQLRSRLDAGPDRR